MIRACARATQLSESGRLFFGLCWQLAALAKRL